MIRAWRTDAAVLTSAAAGAALAAALFTLSAYAVSPLVFPALLVASIVACAALARPAIGVAAVFAAAPFESVSLPLPTGSLTPSEALLALVGVAYLARLAIAPETVVRPGLRDAPFALLLAIGLVGVTFAARPEVVLRVVLLWTLFYCVYLQVQSFTIGEQRLVISALVIAGGVLGAIGAVRYLQSGNAVVFEGGEVTGSRAEGTFENANYYASILQLSIVPGIALLLGRVRNWVLAVPLVLALLGLAFSLSRGGALGLAVGLVILLSWNRARWLGIGLGVVIAVTTIIGANPLLRSEHLTTVEERLSTITQTHESATNSRPRIWHLTVQETADHPLFGIGLNQFRRKAAQNGLTERGQPLENAHNIFLSIAVELGVIALFVFLVFAGQLASRALRALRADDDAIRGLAIGLGAALAGFFIQGLTVNQLRDNLLAGTFLVLAGLLTALARAAGRSATPERA